MALLEISAVCKNYGGLAALDNVNATVETGKIISLIGPNGAGKTTLFNCITGTLPADSGTIRFDGEDITGVPPYQIVEKGIARTFQHIRLFKKMTVMENVLVGYHTKTRSGITSALIRPRWVVEEEKAARERVMEVLGLFQERLLPRANQEVENLSYANQRRVEIARAIVAKPKLLLLDEPTAGMNPKETQGIVDLIYQLRDMGYTIFVIEHKMRLVMTVSDRIIVLDHGVKIAEGPPEVIANDATVAEAYMGKRSHAQTD
ncbi:MAG TPA: ABC transporter ATP-binding protein [Rhodobacteraceae bacterium]|nr:ABC transporter ATP-binding protein [Paracoccaceae bacterium]